MKKLHQEDLAENDHVQDDLDDHNPAYPLCNLLVFNVSVGLHGVAASSLSGLHDNARQCILIPTLVCQTIPFRSACVLVRACPFDLAHHPCSATRSFRNCASARSVDTLQDLSMLNRE